MRELKTDPKRIDLPETGIPVRAKKGNGWVTSDIAHLDCESLVAWLRSRGEQNIWAEGVVMILLGHKEEDKRKHALAAEGPRDKPLEATVDTRELDDLEPKISVYQATLTLGDSEWKESFGEWGKLNAFLKGVEATSSLLGGIYHGPKGL
jgi:hypothetical protein